METLLASDLFADLWIPPYPLLYVVLIIGACLTAGVGILVLSFYEDFYWADEGFRDELRFTRFQREMRDKNKTTYSN